LDDGAYLVTKLIIKMAILGKQNKRLESLIDSLEEPLEEEEIRIKILADDFKKYGAQVIEAIQNYSAVCADWRRSEDNYEGIRISTGADSGNGWFLMRLSVHDPVMVLNAESRTAGGIKTMLVALSGIISSFNELDISAFAQVLKKRSS
jgi:phosphomannomutase